MTGLSRGVARGLGRSVKLSPEVRTAWLSLVALGCSAGTAARELPSAGDRAAWEDAAEGDGSTSGEEGGGADEGADRPAPEAEGAGGGPDDPSDGPDEGGGGPIADGALEGEGIFNQTRDDPETFEAIQVWRHVGAGG